MTEEEYRDETPTLEQATIEIEKHGHDVTEFTAEMGYRATYSGGEVLDWLGY